MAIKNTVKQDQKSAVCCSLSQVVQIYTFCVSIPTTERRNWLPKMRGLYVCRGRILLLLYQGNCPFIQMPWRRSQGNWLFQALPIAAVIGADSYHESLLLEYRFWPMVWPCFHRGQCCRVPGLRRHQSRREARCGPLNPLNSFPKPSFFVYLLFYSG